MRATLERHAARMRLLNRSVLPLAIRRQLRSDDPDIRAAGQLAKQRFFEQLLRDKMQAQSRSFLYGGGDQ